MVRLIFGPPMKAVYNFFIQSSIRLGLVLSLIFFVLIHTACRQEEDKEISIVWKDNQATGITVPLSLLNKNDSVSERLQVRLEKTAAPMLGHYSLEGDHVLFQPVVPLSRGLNYEIFFRDKLIGKINVPHADAAKAPKLLAVYPSRDTVPENLLKFYFRFSAPMREGEALQHIVLLNEQNDTLPNVFLNLQQELWNKERTVLTIWLDPGRIKRDLIPNQEMGNPIQRGKRYTLAVSGKWKDVQGLALQKEHRQSFFVSARDDDSPELASWQLFLPNADTREALVINLAEPLDYFLLQETVSVRDEKNNTVKGTMSIQDDESSIEFVPSHPWKAGRYKLMIASYLEDLAGNNLSRPFDRDVQQQAASKEKEFFEKEFTIAQ